MINAYVNQAKDSANTQNNLNPQQNILPLLKRHTESLLIEEGPTVILFEDIDVIGTFGKGLLLDNGFRAIMDENTLGDITGTETIKHITNPDNKFIERFKFDNLKHPSTTGTWSTANGNVTLTSGQIVQVRAYLDGNNNTTLKTVTVNYKGNNNRLLIEISADGGSNWQTVSKGISSAVTNTGSELFVRITDSVVGNGFPTPFGTWGDTATKTITLITAKYTL